MTDLIVYGGPLDGGKVTGGTFDGVPYRDHHSNRGPMRLVDHRTLVFHQVTEIRGPNFSRRQLCAYYRILSERMAPDAAKRDWIQLYLLRNDASNDDT
jgi:hypothetical protein